MNLMGSAKAERMAFIGGFHFRRQYGKGRSASDTRLHESERMG